jgi:PEP-CTERM motif
MKFKGMMAAAVCLAAIAFEQAAFADPVIFSLTDPNQVGAVGSQLTFMGSLTNVAAPTATIVGDNFSGLPVTLTFDDTPFVTNFLGQDIAGGSTLGPLSVFTVTIEAGAAPGTYDGVFSVLFDSAGGAGQETNFQTFSVTVIPEPTTMWLLGLGLVSFQLGARSRRRAA